MLTRVKSGVKLLNKDFISILKLTLEREEAFHVHFSNVTSLFQLCSLLQHMYLENTLIV